MPVQPLSGAFRPLASVVTTWHRDCKSDAARTGPWHVTVQPRFGKRQRESRMLRSLLVPIDGSESGERAIPLALSIAKRTGARIELLSVHELCLLHDPRACRAPYEPAKDAAFESQGTGTLAHDRDTFAVDCLDPGQIGYGGRPDRRCNFEASPNSTSRSDRDGQSPARTTESLLLR